jgi:predicted RND superfamily exporter protein
MGCLFIVAFRSAGRLLDGLGVAFGFLRTQLSKAPVHDYFGFLLVSYEKTFTLISFDFLAPVLSLRGVVEKVPRHWDDVYYIT